jgi:hypothetical protein
VPATRAADSVHQCAKQPNGCEEDSEQHRRRDASKHQELPVRKTYDNGDEGEAYVWDYLGDQKA